MSDLAGWGINIPNLEKGHVAPFRLVDTKKWGKKLSSIGERYDLSARLYTRTSLLIKTVVGPHTNCEYYR